MDALCKYNGSTTQRHQRLQYAISTDKKPEVFIVTGRAQFIMARFRPNILCDIKEFKVTQAQFMRQARLFLDRTALIFVSLLDRLLYDAWLITMRLRG